MESRKKASHPSAVSGSSSSVSKQRNRKSGSSPCESDHCATCDTKFSIFRKKVRCELCRTMYCGSCWKTGLHFSGVNNTSAETSKTTCKRCKILSGPMYAWNELMQLKTRELVQFLRSKYIDTTACVSKEELADLILQNCSNGATHDQIEHQRRVELMVIRFQQDVSSPSRREPSVVDEATVNARERNSVPSSITISAASQPQTSHPTNTCTTGSSQRSHTSTNSSHNNTSHMDTTDRPDSQNSSTWRQRAPHERVFIEEIESESHLVELSSKQLKDMLAYNFVDYRGVLERCELVDLARSLWRSRNGLQPANAAAPVESAQKPSTNETATAVPSASARREINDRELCKICMEREIDCVLLECGHLVTCTECGRVLADCPICRRYVARVVHIFKT